MQINKINYNNFYVNNYTKQNKNNFLTKKNIENHDKVNFCAKKDYVVISCREADDLKYDLEFTKPSVFKGDFEITGEDVELTIKNKIVSGRDISGTAYNKDISINITSGVKGALKGNVLGYIDGKPIDIKYQGNSSMKSVKLAGNLEDIDSKLMPLVVMLISDKIKADTKAEEAMLLLAVTS